VGAKANRHPLGTPDAHGRYAPLALRFDDTSRRVRLVLHSRYRQPTSGPRTNRYLARLTQGTRTVAERAIALNIARSERGSYMPNSTTVLEAAIDAAGDYVFTLAADGPVPTPLEDAAIEVKA
jgi:hypothetical protein